MGIIMPAVMLPVRESACKTPMAAAELCTTAVKASASSNPETGFCSHLSMVGNPDHSAKGLTAELIIAMPYIRSPNPTNTFPMIRLRSDFANMSRRMPTTATTGEKWTGLSIWIQTDDASIPESERIHAVRVVPTFAPRIT